MSNVKDSLIDLERHRLKLEENANLLRKALQHWQTWDAEYESLKEEVEAADLSSDLERIRSEFEGELVNRKEVDEVFGKGTAKSKDQIINILDRRIDYVTKSINSLQKQLAVTENKAAAASVISHPDARDDEGQPITEIIEELDDDDNVVSYQLNQPGQSLPHIREALEKAGVEDLPDIEPESSAATTNVAVSKQQQPASQKATAAPSQPPNQPNPTPVQKAKKDTKKGVSFAEDTKPAEEEGPDAPGSGISWRAERLGMIMNTAKEQERVSTQQPIIPDDEDPEDAALRREMLNYSMGEVGAVVAELQLEEYQLGDDYEDDLEYSDDDFDEDDEDEDEDKYGRTTHRVVTDKYRQRMLELEKQLGIKSRFTQAVSAEKEDDANESDSENEGIGRIVVNRNSSAASPASTATPKKSEKKGVRFADSLDIASEPKPVNVSMRDAPPVVEPLGDIVERSEATKFKDAKVPRNSSRFKKKREQEPTSAVIPNGPLDAPERYLQERPQETPTGPMGSTIADKLVERETSAPDSSMDDDADDYFDDAELASEHHRLRKKFIQREGGFLREDETPTLEPDDDEESRPVVSRFKAARLSRQ
jgi:unconventional prefoldin RPB5 interactor 1